MQPINLPFAIWLVRSAKGMTQKALAKRMHTSRQQITRLEGGLDWRYQDNARYVKLQTLEQVARGLDVPAKVLIRIAETRAA